MHLNGRLIIRRGGVNLRFAYRNGGVAVNNLAEHAVQGFNTQRKRSNVSQHNVLNLFVQNAALNSRAQSHAFIRVNALVRFLANQLADFILHGGNTSGAANQQHAVNIGSRNAGVAQSLTGWPHSFLHQISGQLIKFSTSQANIQMFGAVLVCCNERQIDIAAQHAGKLNLSFFSRFTQALHSLFVSGKVNALRLFKLSQQIIHNLLIKVIAAQEVVAGSGQHLENTVANFQQGNVKGAAAQVKNQHFLLVGLIQAVSQSSRGGLVDNTHNLQAGNFASVLGCLTLRVGEIRRHGDNRLSNRLA